MSALNWVGEESAGTCISLFCVFSYISKYQSNLRNNVNSAKLIIKKKKITHVDHVGLSFD
jgi:hypothetical protein